MSLIPGHFRVALVALGSLVGLAASGRAQVVGLEADTSSFSRPSPKAKLVKMMLHPAPLPLPALRYQLLPEVRDLTPGNAALLYQRAHSLEWWSNYRTSEIEKMADLLDMPLRKMPRNKIVLLAGPLKEMDRAARREYCDWELTPRLREDGYALLLPDIQGFRTFGQMIALRSRTEMLDGRLDKAIDSFQTGFALSRHVGDAPILINALVGMAIGQVMINRLEEFVQLDKAPNLYWALADLPRPFVDLRRPFQGEKVGTDGMFAEIRAALKDPTHAAVPVQLIMQRLDKLAYLGIGAGDNRLLFALGAARAYPRASSYLASNGWSAEQIKALPVIQVALMYALVLFDETFDETYKWQSFPYWQARGGMAKAIAKFTNLRNEQPEATFLAALLIPATNKVAVAKARLERRLCMMQVVEALRFFASDHEKWPARLEDIQDVPIPIDPVSGKAFEYTLEDNRAILYGPPPPGELASEANAVRYELTLAPLPKH